MNHLYYKIKIKLLSPLAVGSGQSKKTDKDIIRDSRDSRGKPVIPATTLAGIYRSLISDQEDKTKLFGNIVEEKTQSPSGPVKKDKPKPIPSALFIYDAISTHDTSVSVRDNVALDEYKTAKDGSKFDFEILETGAEFITYIEVFKNTEPVYYDEKIKEMLSALNSGEMNLGSKTTRGFGWVKIEAWKLTFDLEENLKSWLEFDMFDERSWSVSEPVALNTINGDMVIILELKQKGGISIRRYATDVYADKDSAPDYIQLTLNDNAEGSAEPGTPVIPGTSWAGAFRHHYSLLGGKKECENDLFGFVQKDKESKTAAAKSKISFSESRLTGGVWKTITRNAIDRFSAGTKEGALYTEKTYYNGSCQLEIRIKSGTCKTGISYIPASVFDLHNGFLAIGGLTAVGRGLFEINSLEINGQKKDFLENCNIGGFIQCLTNG